MGIKFEDELISEEDLAGYGETLKRAQEALSKKVISTRFHEEPLIPIDTSKMIFVFGSNEAGRHGAGAARFALEHRGADYGTGHGLHGQSYAIPTKDHEIQSLPKRHVLNYVLHFIQFAQEHPELTFQVTAIGCGLAGFKHEDIAPMFVGAPNNCFFDTLWKPWLPEKRFWGTF